MIIKVKGNLKLEDESRDLALSDIIYDVKTYCNISDLPDALEPFIRKKLQGIISYEREFGADNIFDVSSISEGDTSISYNTKEVSKDTIYSFSKSDKAYLNRFRRLRK